MGLRKGYENERKMLALWEGCENERTAMWVFEQGLEIERNDELGRSVCESGVKVK